MATHSFSTRRRFLGASLAGGLGSLSLPGLLSADPAREGPIFGLCANPEKAGLVKASGGDFIELSVAGWLEPGGPEEAFAGRLKAVRETGLPVPVCNSFIRPRHLKCTGPEANHDEVLAYVDQAFSRAQEAGVHTIVFGSSGARRVPKGWAMDKATDQFVALLKRMGPLAEAKGVTIAVEPLNKRECNFINNISEVAEVVRRVAHPAVNGVADLYHMAVEKDTPEDLRQAMDAVHHVEIAQAEGRKLPAKGGQDFRPWFKVLKEAKFAGTLSMEGRWKDGDVAPAFVELRRQWGEA